MQTVLYWLPLPILGPLALVIVAGVEAVLFEFLFRAGGGFLLSLRARDEGRGEGARESRRYR